MLDGMKSLAGEVKPHADFNGRREIREHVSAMGPEKSFSPVGKDES